MPEFKMPTREEIAEAVSHVLRVRKPGIIITPEAKGMIADAVSALFAPLVAGLARLQASAELPGKARVALFLCGEDTSPEKVDALAEKVLTGFRFAFAKLEAENAKLRQAPAELMSAAELAEVIRLGHWRPGMNLPFRLRMAHSILSALAPRFAAVVGDRDTLKEFAAALTYQRDKAEAEAAAMREALTQAQRSIPSQTFPPTSSAHIAIANALSSTAGQALLDELAGLKRQTVRLKDHLLDICMTASKLGNGDSFIVQADGSGSNALTLINKMFEMGNALVPQVNALRAELATAKAATSSWLALEDDLRDKLSAAKARETKLRTVAQAAADVMERAKKLLRVAGFTGGGTITTPYVAALENLRAALAQPQAPSVAPQESMRVAPTVAERMVSEVLDMEDAVLRRGVVRPARAPSVAPKFEDIGQKMKDAVEEFIATATPEYVDALLAKVRRQTPAESVAEASGYDAQWAAENALRSICMTLRPGYDPGDDEGADAASIEKWVLAELAALTARLTAAEADTRRLDWLLANQGKTFKNADGKWDSIESRAAIDSAMATGGHQS